MKRLQLSFLLLTAWFTTMALFASDADSLVGKWSAKHVSQQWHSASQTLEIKKNKFTFEMLDSDGQVVLHAEGDLKLQKQGPFSAVLFTHIRGGESASSLDEVDDEYNSIYTLDGDSWTLAMNFDKERDEAPYAVTYQRVATPTKTLVIDEIDMENTPQYATWYLCFEASVGGTSHRHYVEDKGYDKNKVRIPVGLEIPGVQPGQKCSFKLQLDDVDGDACGDDADNRSTGEFAINEGGKESYKPEDRWRYTIRWHLK